MKLEDQVCTAEQSKRLWQLGIAQSSLFQWLSFRNESSPKDQWANVHTVCEPSEKILYYEEKTYLKDLVYYSAFTVSELSQMMPYKLQFEGEECFISTAKFETKSVDFVGYRQNKKVERNLKFECCIASCPTHEKKLIARKYFMSETQAGALADCLIFLLEKNHISVTDANQRLHL